ncbi:MAG: mechanosensitive ion channel family protein [Massiliimalia sp.]
MEFFIDTYGSKLLSCVLILAIGGIIIKVAVALFKKALKKSPISVTMHKFLTSALSIALIILLAIIVLDNWGVPTTSLVAAFSVFGLAISLAVKDSLANVASGVILLVTKPFDVGDYVELNGVEGTVNYINMLTTKLNTFDNKAIYIPNGQISSDRIVNYTREENRRLDLVFSIGYGDDFQKAKKIISEIIDAHPLAVKTPEPVVRMCEHNQSSIDICAKVWVKSSDYWNLKYDLLEEVKIQFDKNDINIPYPQLDVHLKQ